MGKQLFDKYTYLHFAVGIVTYFWNISFTWMIIIHTLFEILENTPTGIYMIDKYITFWPGGKFMPIHLLIILVIPLEQLSDGLVPIIYQIKKASEKETG